MPQDNPTISSTEFQKRYGKKTAEEAPLTLSAEEFTRLYGNLDDLEAVQPQTAQQPGMFEKAYQSFGLGSAELVGQPLATGAGLLGFPKASEKIRKRLGEIRSGVQKEVPELAKQFDVSDLADPSFYATKGVAALPALMALAGTSAAGAAGATRAGTSLISKLGAGKKATAILSNIIGKLGAGAASRTVEGAIEASGVYNQLLDEGIDNEKAAEAAAKVFRNNYSLVGMDAAQFALATMKVPKPLATGFGKFITRMVTGGLAAGSEGAEEWWQGYMGDTATRIAKGEKNIDGLSVDGFWDYINKAPFWQQEEFVIGALFGLGFHVGEGAIEKYGRTEGELRANVKRNPHGIINTIRRIMRPRGQEISQQEAVAQRVYGTPFDELTDEQKASVSETVANTRQETEAEKLKQAAQETVAQPAAGIPPAAPTPEVPTKPKSKLQQQLEARRIAEAELNTLAEKLAPEAFGKSYAELTPEQQTQFKTEIKAEKDKADAVRRKQIIAREFAPKEEKPASEKKPILIPEGQPEPTTKAPILQPEAPAVPSAAELPPVAPVQPVSLEAPTPEQAAPELAAQPTLQEAARAEKAPVLEPSEEKPREFSSTQTPLSKDVSNKVVYAAEKIIDKEDVHPVEGLEKEPHITVKFGLHTNNADEVRKLLADEKPIQAKIEGIEIFKPENEDYDVVVARVSSDDLTRLNKKISDNVENTETQPSYKPHITLGYVKKGTGEKYAKAQTGLEGQTVTLDTVEFSGKDKKITPIKLGGAEPEETVLRPAPTAKDYESAQAIFDKAIAEVSEKTKTAQPIEKGDTVTYKSKQYKVTGVLPSGKIQIKAPNTPAFAINRNRLGVQPKGGREFTEAQQKAARIALEAANVHPAIVDELTEPRRAPRPEEENFPEKIGIGEAYDLLRKVESKQYATTRKGRIERTIEPPTNLKPKVNAIADATKIFADANAQEEQGRKDIIKDIEQRGGEVVVNADTGAFTINLRPGKLGLASTIALKKLRAEAAEAGAYSLAMVGRRIEIAGTPETIADAEPLKGTFAEKVKEYIRRKQAVKAAIKNLDAAKKDAYNDLVDNYLAERAAGREPKSFKGVASDGTAVEVMARRQRSAIEPDIAAGGRNFPAEIEAAKEAAPKKRGEPFLETRKAGKEKIEKAKKGGTYVAEQETEYSPRGRAIPDEITVNGKKRPTRNSKGQLIHRTEKGIENFWKWFGESKVTDEQGRPLIENHGTGAEFNVFDINKRSVGLYGSGFYFTIEKALAESYADAAKWRFGIGKPNVIAAYLKMENPLYWPKPYTAEENAILKQLGIERKPSGGRPTGDVLSKAITDAGYDGVIGYEEYGKEYVVFKPTQIKSTENVGTYSPTEPSILRESESPYIADRIDSKTSPTFYSQLYTTLDLKLPNSGTVEQMQQAISAFQKKGEFKKDEIEWLGLNEWLAEKKGKITKQEILDFVKENQVGITEVEKGEEEELTKLPNDFKVEEGDDGFWQVFDAEGSLIAESRDKGPAIRDALEYLNERRKPGAKFAQYVLPGGENYRELLLTMPNQNAAEINQRIQNLKNEFSAADIKRREEIQNEIAELKKNQAKQQEFISSHFDEPNILAHVRFNERTDADGKRVLFVEEIQSDWHQAGRKQGYKQGDEALRESIRARQQEIYRRFDNNEITKEQRNAELDALDVDKKKLQGVPNAPFKTSWHELAFKRILRYATDNDFERIAWTTGEQQNERYDLSKQVKSLRVTRQENDKYNIEAIPADGKNTYQTIKSDVAENDLETYIGKDIARKILSGQADESGGNDAWNEVTKPESVFELAKNIFGREMAMAMPLNVMDGGVLATFKYDQIRQAVISRIPVNVMDIFIAEKFTPNEFFANPQVIFNSLAVDRRNAVAFGIVNAIRETGAFLRTKLRSPETAGGQEFLLPALRASKFNAREIAGLLDPQRLFHFRAGGIPEKSTSARPGAESLSLGGGVIMSGEEIGSAELARLLNIHSNGNVGILKQRFKSPEKYVLSGKGLKIEASGMKGFYDKILPEFVNKYTKKWGGKVGETNIPSGNEKVFKSDRRWYQEDAAGMMDVERSWATKEEALKALTPTVHSLDITPAMREAVSRGQALFEKTEPYEPNYDKRPDASEKTDRLAKEAVESIGVNRRRGRVLLANAISAEAREKGTVSLVGKEVRTSDDVAALAQVYRDPRWETLRYIFVKDGKVVFVTGVSSRLPAATAHFPVTEQSDIEWLQDLMFATGADGYYMMHNHPSGEIESSFGDRTVTKKLADNVNGFLGHVIIDSNKYTVLTKVKDISKRVREREGFAFAEHPGGIIEENIEKFFGEEKLLVPSVSSPVLGTKINTAEKLAEIGLRYQSQKGWVTLVSHNRAGVRGMMEVEASQLANPKKAAAIMRRFARQTGAGDVFIVGSEKFIKAHEKQLARAIEQGFLRDAVSIKGYSILENQSIQETGAEFGITGKLGGREVREGRLPQPRQAKRGTFSPTEPSIVREEGAEHATKKQPWEMTRDEWVKEQGKLVSGQSAAKTRKLAKLLHKDHVRIWLKEGKPVSESVLAEYPELAKETASRHVALLQSVAEETQKEEMSQADETAEKISKCR